MIKEIARDIFRRKKQKIIIIAVAASLIAAGAYFLFPGATAQFLTHAKIVIAQAWGETVDQEASISTSDISSNETSSDVNEGEPPLYIVGGSSTPAEAVPVEITSTTPQTNTTVTTTVTVIDAPLMECNVSSSLAASPSHTMLINEIAWMGSVPLPGETASKAANREWIELKNISGATVDISNWQLTDVAGKIKIVFDIGAHLPARWFYLLARGGGEGASTTLPGVMEDKGYTGTMTNTGGTLVLLDAHCGVVDSIDATTGWPAGNNTTKQTLERDSTGFGWHTSTMPGGTPRAENSALPAPTVITPVATPTTTNETATTTTVGAPPISLSTTTSTPQVDCAP